MGILGNQRLKTYCYCSSQVVEIGPVDTSDLVIKYNGIEFTPCSEWMGLFIKTQSLQKGILIVIPLVNLVLSILLECIYVI
jgi:hypothetical protein